MVTVLYGTSAEDGRSKHEQEDTTVEAELTDKRVEHSVDVPPGDDDGNVSRPCSIVHASPGDDSKGDLSISGSIKHHKGVMKKVAHQCHAYGHAGRLQRLHTT